MRRRFLQIWKIVSTLLFRYEKATAYLVFVSSSLSTSVDTWFCSTSICSSVSTNHPLICHKQFLLSIFYHFLRLACSFCDFFSSVFFFTIYSLFKKKKVYCIHVVLCFLKSAVTAGIICFLIITGIVQLSNNKGWAESACKRRIKADSAGRRFSWIPLSVSCSYLLSNICIKCLYMHRFIFYLIV